MLLYYLVDDADDLDKANLTGQEGLDGLLIGSVIDSGESKSSKCDLTSKWNGLEDLFADRLELLRVTLRPVTWSHST